MVLRLELSYLFGQRVNFVYILYTHGFPFLGEIILAYYFLIFFTGSLLATCPLTGQLLVVTFLLVRGVTFTLDGLEVPVPLTCLACPLTGRAVGQVCLVVRVWTHDPRLRADGCDHGSGSAVLTAASR